jgi:Ca-activated chloride channel family protein
MRFDSPWMLLLLFVLPWLFARSRRPAGRRPAVLWNVTPALSEGWRARIVRAADVLPWLALAMAVVALARPQQGVRQTETETRGVDIVLAIDVSSSMKAEDFQPRNRLVVAKQQAREFIRQRAHDRVGLVAFAGSAFHQCPLTLDHQALEELLGTLDFDTIDEDGTAIGMGLATAVSGLRESRTPSKVVVLLTDGSNNRGQIDPMTAAELARAYGVRVYSVLVGRGGLVPVPVDDPVFGRRTQMARVDVDEGTMREIARRTGGRYFNATDPQTLAEIYAQIDRLERAPLRAISYREYFDLGPALLGWAAAVLGLYLASRTTWASRTP